VKLGWAGDTRSSRRPRPLPVTLVPTVALVEDNADNRLVVQLLLSIRYQVRDFESGAAALAALAAPGAELPDVVLTDIDMPEMDGLEVLRRIRAAPALAALPVVAVTAHAMRGYREQLLAAGFDDYVSKPIVDEAALFAVIDRCIARRAERDPGGTRDVA
jgi:CheY-like chemotaxis protein